MLLLVLPACASLAPRFPPSAPPAASGVDPALDAETRLLDSAYRAFAQERYSLASTLLQRFVDSHHNSPRLSEVRWWLARSYERQGDLPGALAAYRALVGEAPESSPRTDSYEYHALIRLDAFRKTLGPSSLLEQRQIALWLPGNDWLTVHDIPLFISQLAAAGVTALIIEAGTPTSQTIQSGPIGAYFQTSTLPVVEDLFAVIVPAAHARGMAVLASLNMHEPGWMPLNPEWDSYTANRTDRMLPPIGHVDVLHPEYQRFVGDVAQDLLRTGIDGFVFETRRDKGFADEWSPASRRQFEETFVGPFDSRDQFVLLNPWRWAGWKMRAYVGFVARMTQQLRQTRQGLLVAVAVHERAVFSPTDALTEYGEDVFEVKQRGLHIMVLPEPGSAERFELPEARLETVQQRLALTARDESRTWLGVALDAPDTGSLATRVKAILATKIGTMGTHLLLTNHSRVP